MQTIICLDKEDIKTSPIGNNYSIRLGDQFSLSIAITKEAIVELYNDMLTIEGLKQVHGHNFMTEYEKKVSAPLTNENSEPEC